MDTDLKATLTGVVTGILGLVSIWVPNIPTWVGPTVISIGVVVLGYFTNKKAS